MRVLVVAKTRQGSRACVGGITSEGQSVRLVAIDAETNDHAGMDFAVGEVWEIDFVPAEKTSPPHVENVIVHGKSKLGRKTNLVPTIEQYMPPKCGGLEVLFEGLAQVTETGVLYIAERTGLPPYSTMFWRPDRPLQRSDVGKRIRYRYAAPDGSRTLTFVGFQEPVETIPAGSLLRVSLAHWWRPKDAAPDAEYRCYVQLSGWFLAPEADAPSHALPEQPAGVSPAAAKAPPRPASPGPAEARRLLKSVFGYDAYRPMQAEIIANLLAQRDTLAIMPTGSGKSLCYQLPALLFGGLTVVVSPLIALMQDQVGQLRELGVPAVFLNSTLDYQDYLATAGQVRQGKIKLLYTSPETLLRPETLVLLDRSQVDCLAIDEAHCISAWGHDFRPEYRQLLPIRQRYPGAVCVAFTATATPRVQRDIKETLGFRDENEFLASFNRANLYLESQQRTAGLSQTLAFLTAHRDQSGIIYCGTRRQVDSLALGLQEKGWPVLPYHAGMENEARRRNQELFVRDRVPIMIATIAFGMGINKPNVRFILHYNLPPSIENYYQEIGRAGRDGLPADCLLLFSRADLQTHQRFIDEGAAAERPGRQARLQAMLRYAETPDCRRKLLLEYFGEATPEAPCDFCDNCRSTGVEEEQQEVTEAARQFLTLVKLTGQVFGAGHLIDVLRGSQAQKVRRYQHERLPLYAAGTGHSAAEWKYLAEQFIRQGLLVHDMEHGSLLLSARGQEVLAGARVFVAAERARPAPAATAGEELHDAELFDRLRTLRRQLADASNLPPYAIFSDRSLIEMATWLPHSAGSLLRVHGVGEHKLQQYGEQFLAVIRGYCAEHGLAERAGQPDAAQKAASSPRGSSRAEAIGELFAAGHSVPEIQALYGIGQRTVIDHLYHCVLAGQALPPGRLLELSELTNEEQERVLAAIRRLGTERLRPIYDALSETVAFDGIAILRLYYLCTEVQSQARNG